MQAIEDRLPSMKIELSELLNLDTAKLEMIVVMIEAELQQRCECRVRDGCEPE